MRITPNSIVQLKLKNHTRINTCLEGDFNSVKIYWKYIVQYIVNLPLVGKRVPKTSFDLFF